MKCPLGNMKPDSQAGNAIRKEQFQQQEHSSQTVSSPSDTSRGEEFLLITAGLGRYRIAHTASKWTKTHYISTPAVLA